MSENEEAVSRPSVPLPGEEWTEQEQYVWAQVAQGEIANLLTRYQGSDDPTDAEGWPEERVLRPGFLETILFEEPFRSEVRRAGVDIVGAWFREPLDLSQGQIGFVLALQSSRMASDVRCRRLHASADFGFKASAFAGKLDMDGFQVDGSLFMLESVFGEVNLRGARVGDQLAMSGSTFGGTLNMDSLHTRSALLMDDGGTFEEVVLRCARIGGQLAMVASTFTGSLNMNAVQVEGSLLMSGGATFKEVVLRSARIGDQLAMVGSTFNGRIDMTCMQVDGPVFMRSPARFVSDVSMIRIDAKDVLDIRSASFGGVLDLRLATVGVLRDAADAWPEELRLEGFTYATWDESIGKLAPRKAKWFVDWIRRSEGYHPKTYDQCASVLQAAGYDRMANGVRYAGEWRRLWRRPFSPYGFLQWLMTGFGYRIWYAFVWAALIFGVGVAVFDCTGQAAGQAIQNGVHPAEYSLDLLLPLVKLRDAHYTKIDLRGPARWYFYTHQLAGYLLGYFLVAGLAQFVRRSRP